MNQENTTQFSGPAQHNSDNHLVPQLIQTPNLHPLHVEQVPILTTHHTAAIYFCIVDDKYDKTSTPNKLILARSMPTVSDLCSTLKALLYPGQDVCLTATFSQGGVIGSTEYPEQSLIPVPINDKNSVVLLKATYMEGGSKLIPQQLQMLHWLQANNLDTPEVSSIFIQHKITLDNMKYLKDGDLIAFGVKDWGTRIAILESVNKYFALLPTMLMDVQGTMRQNVIDQYGQMQEANLKRKFEQRPSMDYMPNKRPKTPPQKKRIRFKDLDVLVNDPIIPVEIGSGVLCQGSNLRGTVVLNKQKKPVIEFSIKGRKHSATIAQFYKAATGEPLQAKGDSWTKIFFTDTQTNVPRSLEELKYIVKGPKKAVSAFLYFSKEIRGTLPKSADFAKKSGDMWKNLSEEQKQKYRIKEIEDKERFNREKAHWTLLTSSLRQRNASQTNDDYED